MQKYKKPKNKVNLTKTKNRGSMPYLPANIANLPKNIPPLRKYGTYFDPWWDYEDKIDDVSDALKVKRLEVKQRKSKKIKYKKISLWEYEITATDRSVGVIKENSSSKWKIEPSFKYDEDLYSRITLKTEYHDFSEAGRALVEMWINS